MSDDRPYHRPVLCAELITALAPKPHGVYVDATFGGGGHTRRILEYEPTCTVIGFDWDERALAQNGPAVEAAFPGRFVPVWANFAHIRQKLHKLKISQIDGLVADLGTSQFQLKHAAGFSFTSDEPLDMRMSPAHHTITAEMLVNQASEQELTRILWEFGEERHAREIARALIAQRPVKTGRQLAELVRAAVRRQRDEPLGRAIHPATRVFQALRIAVNREFEAIRSLVLAAGGLVRPGGRMVCITFHSLEDRLVKQLFVEQRELWSPLTKHVVVPTPEEVVENPSARSAKLRALVRREQAVAGSKNGEA